jgi:prevent-host-death family protein
VKTISQRELRNDSGEVMRGVEEGETYLVTRRGVPVARLVPLSDEPDLRCSRPAKKHGGFGELTRFAIEGTVAEELDALRGER